MGKKRLVAYLLVLSFILTMLPLSLYAQANPPSIANIWNIEAVTVQGKVYKLPATVNGILSDYKPTKFAVKWDKAAAQTSKIGVYEFKGTVQGYSKPVILTLRVIAPIVSIKNLETTILINQRFTPPALIDAVCKDKSINKVPVTWKPVSLDTSKTGRYVLQGTVQYYSKKVTLIVNVKGIYSAADNLSVTLKHNQAFTLPKTVKATAFDNTKEDALVIWPKQIDTTKVGKGVIEGLVLGCSKHITLSYEVVPYIASVPDKNITVIKGGSFALPSNIEATMSDGSKKSFNVSWTPAQIDTQKISTTEVIGKIEGYEKPIKWVINVKTDLAVTSKVISYTQWNYIAVTFNKPISACTLLDNIILKDSDGVQVAIAKAVPGIPDRNVLIMTPIQKLDRNKQYTLTILKNSVQAAGGDFYPEDITFTIQMK